MQREVLWCMAPRKKPFKRPSTFVPKKPQDIEISAEDVLFLEKISEEKASLEKAPPVSLKHDGLVAKFWMENMTFVDSVKLLSAQCYNGSERVLKDPTPKEKRSFLNQIRRKSDDLFHLLGEGKVKGHYRLSFNASTISTSIAEEELYYGTLSIDDPPAVKDLRLIKNIRRDLKLLEDLIRRRRGFEKQRLIVDSMFDQMRKMKSQGQPASDKDLVAYLVKEHSLEHHHASKLVSEKNERSYSPSKKGRPEDTLSKFTIRDVIELCTNWGIKIKRHEPDKPADDEEPSKASPSDFFRVLDIVFSSAGKNVKYIMDDWEKYKEDPLEPLPQ